MSVSFRVDDARLQSWVSGSGGREVEFRERFQDEGSLLVVGEMRLQVPFKSGFLRESVTRIFTPSGFSVYPAASYGKVVNEGSAPHVIYPVGRALRFELPGGGVVFARRVRHPGFAGRRFVERTAEAVRESLRDLASRIFGEVYRA